MASFYTMGKIADHQAFQARVCYCITKAAVAVMAEDAQTPNHAERVAYAKAVLSGAASVAEYSRAVVTNSTLTANGVDDPALFGISDGDLEFTVNSMFNAMAGVAT
jgi:hypothetical protein